MKNITDTIKYLNKLKLLYVEDDQDARESTMTILEIFFDTIIVAVDGEDGYEKFVENEIDLIIADINMPKLNGMEMIKKIREIDENIYILVLSAHNEPDYFIDSIKLGVEGYLLKPIDMKQFLGVLNRVVEKIKLKIEASNYLHLNLQYQNATDKSSIVSKTDTAGIITYANEEFIKISEYSKEELIGSNHNIIRDPSNPKSLYIEIWETIKNKKQIWQGIVRNITKSGKSYYVKTTIQPILDKDNNILEYIALRDNITSIMNPKKLFLDAIENLNEPLVVYMKLEDFSTLEDFYDNKVVENIQIRVTQMLEENIPSDCDFDKVYQFGNGEFAMLNEADVCLRDKEGFLLRIKKYQNIIKEKVIQVSDIEYDASILISLAYKDDKVLESAKLGINELLKDKKDFIIANNLAQLEQEKAQKNMNTISMIKEAIEDSRIVSYFQPIINNKTQKIEKYESLVRLIDKDGKILSPFFFLDIAKKGKYYSQITSIVLDNSFRALDNTEVDISINLSALDIEDKTTREKIFKLLKKSENRASRVVFELLEDESVKDFITIKNFIEDVKKFGVKIAIDDFGAGYSNFERLLDYQPDILKIDACLIRDIQTNSYSLSVVKTIVAFAKEQNIQTVAEFVENEHVFKILKDMGVDYTQGYYFGKPEPLSNYC